MSAMTNPDLLYWQFGHWTQRIGLLYPPGRRRIRIRCDTPRL